NPGPTNVEEIGYIPAPSETTLTYDVCLVNDTTGQRSCGTPIVLTGTSDHCECAPNSCDMMGACNTTINDGCGHTLTCGNTCSADQTCGRNHLCSAGGGNDCTPFMAAHHLCS
ncbi:MAG TPA: hypothetical protein VFQ65_26285, partial [Kofleriaceae bacterium]|nr:hypothetical protein [Kofleriaceae bacterium]